MKNEEKNIDYSKNSLAERDMTPRTDFGGTTLRISGFKTEKPRYSQEYSQTEITGSEDVELFFAKCGSVEAMKEKLIVMIKNCNTFEDWKNLEIKTKDAK